MLDQLNKLADEYHMSMEAFNSLDQAFLKLKADTLSAVRELEIRNERLEADNKRLQEENSSMRSILESLRSALEALRKQYGG